MPTPGRGVAPILGTFQRLQTSYLLERVSAVSIIRLSQSLPPPGGRGAGFGEANRVCFPKPANPDSRFRKAKA